MGVDLGVHPLDMTGKSMMGPVLGKRTQQAVIPQENPIDKL